MLALAAGGFAKGVVGFALPLIALSLAGSFVPYEVAVALLIVPMLVSNLFQALRQGIGPALGSLRRFWRLNLVLVAMIALAAQLVVALPDRVLFAILGVAVSAFGASQLAGWQPQVPDAAPGDGGGRRGADRRLLRRALGDLGAAAHHVPADAAAAEGRDGAGAEPVVPARLGGALRRAPAFGGA